MPHADPFALRALLGPHASLAHRAITGEHGVALPPFTDHHVHLHLIDAEPLASHGVAGVVDLGGDPVSLARRRNGSIPKVVYTGAFLTAKGGYPVGRPWAPDEIVREVTDPTRHAGAAGGAATAVDEQAAFGASVIKIALNSMEGAVLDRTTLDAVVASARERGLPTVAHVQGDGMTRLALDAGVDALAHTPFSEVLTPDLVERAVEQGQAWISTLAIHDTADGDRALENARAFVAAGGTMLYGTDLGNGDRPSGLQAREIALLDAAGVRGAALVAALADPWPSAAPLQGVASFVAGDPPTTLDDVPAWLGGAVVVPEEELVTDDR
jgi:hypothetical protein